MAFNTSSALISHLDDGTAVIKLKFQNHSVLRSLAAPEVGNYECDVEIASTAAFSSQGCVESYTPSALHVDTHWRNTSIGVHSIDETSHLLCHSQILACVSPVLSVALN